jgi:peptidoglycan/xylan/chitin deacetylase (PgdA/CDA1 family)
MVLATIAYGAGTPPSEKVRKGPAKNICLTFDELPVAVGLIPVNRQEITALILESLAAHKVSAAGFVVGAYIEDDFDLLGDWLNGGHVLGNLTKSHQDLHALGADNFIREIAACDRLLEPMLEGFGQKRRYFRYPFLHYGNTIASKRHVRDYLDTSGRIVGHATILAEDFLYNLSLEKLGENPDTLDVDRIGSDYLYHVLGQIELAEEAAEAVLRRPVSHILLLRANRLNALVLDELLIAIEERGYGFISLDEALRDELYAAPEAYYGPRVAGYIEMIKMSDPDLLPAQ